MKKSPKKGRRKLSPDPEPQVPAAPQPNSWMKDICNAQISSAIALAVVIFAAGSTMAIAGVAAPTVANYSDVSMVNPTRLIEVRVLGASTSVIDDSALEAGSPTGSISAKPISFDSTVGRWDYNIIYNVSNLIGSATLDIGTYNVQGAITTSGKAETGSILKPSFTYHVFLWVSDSSGSTQKLAQFELKTPKAGSSAKPITILPPCLAGQPSASGAPIPGPSSSTTMPMPTPGSITPNAPTSHSPCAFIPQEGMGRPGYNEGARPSSSNSSAIQGVLFSLPKNAVAGTPVQVGAGIFPHKDVTFTFSWGDGSANDVQATPASYYSDRHTYATAGSYTFTATAVDSSGVSASKTGAIVVSAASAATPNQQ